MLYAQIRGISSIDILQISTFLLSLFSRRGSAEDMQTHFLRNNL